MTGRQTDRVHDLLRQHVEFGDVVVDATAGNGHDTVFLSELVGPVGHVYVFDIQTQAIEMTRLQLDERKNVSLIHACHSQLAEHLRAEHHGSVSAIVFNLGYLPGGDKSVVTRNDTSTQAIRAAARVLRAGGVLSVLAYVGHSGGTEEAAQVEATIDEATEFEWLQRDAPTGLRPRLYFATRTIELVN